MRVPIVVLSVLFGLFVAAAAAVWLAPGAVLALGQQAGRLAASLRTDTVTVAGHRIAYVDSGSGEALVALHGFGGNKDNWLAVAPYLTPHVRLIAPDLPGFGDSSFDQHQDYGLQPQLERLHAFTLALGLERFHLAGNSMGGHLAALYAARHPGRVASLWLLAPAGFGTDQPSEFETLLAKKQNPLLIAAPEDFSRLLDFTFVTPPALPGPLKRQLGRQAMERGHIDRRIFDDLMAEHLRSAARVEGLATPTLITWGDGDRVIHPSGAVRLDRLLPNSAVDILARTGHLPMIEAPERAAQGYLRFQRERQAAPPS